MAAPLFRPGNRVVDRNQRPGTVVGEWHGRMLLVVFDDSADIATPKFAGNLEIYEDPQLAELSDNCIYERVEL